MTAVQTRPWLVTGGAGYIGSHVVRSFIDDGLNVVVLDDLSTGVRERVPDGIAFVEANCANASVVHEIITQHSITGVVHLAAYKHARESLVDPITYWNNNVGAMLGVMTALSASDVDYFVLSSSCSVYGASGQVNRRTNLNPISPYAKTKYVSELILQDCASQMDLSWIALRYFNVIGNSEFPHAYDTSKECLIPATVSRLNSGLDALIFGTDFATDDGTALRDYVDVRDLSNAHLAAARNLMAGGQGGIALDVGRGKPASVLNVVTEICSAMGHPVTYIDEGRNSADPAAVWARCDEIENYLGWTARHDLKSSIEAHVKACRDGSKDGELFMKSEAFHDDAKR